MPGTLASRHYLIAAEMGVHYGSQMVFQLRLAKSLGALPIARDYMVEAGMVRSD